MKFPIFLMACLWACSISAQGILPGLVTYQNSGKQPVPGAIIKVGLANETETAADGSFSMTLPGRQPGYEVVIKVEKAGYEVVNKAELQTYALRADAAKRLKIWMCPAGQWEQNALAHYHINRDTITATYKRRVADLKRELRDQHILQDSLSVLARQYQAVIAQAEELANLFATANLDDASDMFREAHAYFTTGQIDSALIALDEDELDRLTAAAHAEIAEAEQLEKAATAKRENARRALEQSSRGFATRAKLLISQFRFEEAYQNYEKAIEAAPEDIDLHRAYARILTDQNRLLEGREILYKVKKRTQNPVEKWECYIDLTYIHIFLDQHTKALACLDSAYVFLKEGEGISEKRRETRLKRTYDIYTSIYTDQKSFDLAQEYLEKSLDIAAQDTLRGGPNAKNGYAISLQKKANLFSEAKKYPEALGTLKEILRIKKSLIFDEKIARIPLQFLINTLWDMGGLQEKMGKYPLAVDAFKEGLNLLQDIALHDTLRYGPVVKRHHKDARPQVALLNKELGDVYIKMAQFDSSSYYHSIALEKYGDLSSENPELYRPELASIHRSMANAHSRQGNLSEAQSNYTKAFNIYESLATEKMYLYARNLSYVLGQKARLFNRQKQYQIGLEHIQQSIAYSRLEVSEKTNRRTTNLASKYALMGFFYSQVDSLPSATNAWVEATTLLADEPANFATKYITAILKDYVYDGLLGLIKKSYPAIQNAEGYAERVDVQQHRLDQLFTLLKGLDQAYWPTYLLAVEKGNMAWYAVFIEKFQFAESSAREALALDPKVPFINTNLAHALLLQGKFKEAKAIYEHHSGPSYNPDRSWEEIFLADLAELESAKVIPRSRKKDVKKIRKMLKP